MLNWQGTGLSVMEMSHRGKDFRQIAEHTRNSLRAMLSIPDDFEVLITQGGPEMQHSALCYNLLGQHKTINFVVTGEDSTAAMREMAKFASVNVVCDATNQPALINSPNWSANKNADFCHIVDDDKSSGIELQEMT